MRHISPNDWCFSYISRTCSRHWLSMAAAKVVDLINDTSLGYRNLFLLLYLAMLSCALLVTVMTA